MISEPVKVRIAQRLSEKIKTMTTEFGSTPDGSAWCLKALHPSDPMVEVRGIPDKSAVPSTFLNYQTVTRINAPAGTTEDWNFVAQFQPNPVNFGWWTNTDADEIGVGTFYGIPNSQLDGVDLAAKSRMWANTCERWRIAYAGITVHFEGPALSNQGTLAVCQTPYAPRTRTLSAKNVDGAYVTWPDVCFPDGTFAPSWHRGRDYPTFATCESMPNSYVGEAKEGCYIPMKLTKTCQQWLSNSDRVAWSQSMTDVSSNDECIKLPSTATQLGYPHPGLPCAFINSAGTASSGANMPKNGSDIVANLIGRYLSPATALVVECRYGFEIQCEPGSALSPFLRMCPMYDSQAIKTYFAIARELKAAYPADYNDLGKLWDVIKRVASVVGPSLAFVPKIGPLLAGAAGLLSHSGSSRSQRSETDLERDKETVKRAVTQGQARLLSKKIGKQAKRSRGK